MKTNKEILAEILRLTHAAQGYTQMLRTNFPDDADVIKHNILARLDAVEVDIIRLKKLENTT